MKKIFTTSFLVIVGLLFAGQVALADSSLLIATSPFSEIVEGSNINVAVSVNPNENNVCVVKGTVVMNNLTCNSITLENGIIAQTAPTCLAPNFTLGIPKCTLDSKALFTVSAKGSESGQAYLSFDSVKVVGVGVDVPSTSQGVTYQVINVSETPGAYFFEPMDAPVKEPIATTSQEVTSTSTGFFKNAGAVVMSVVSSEYVWKLAIIIIVFSALYALYYYAKEKVETEEKK